LSNTNDESENDEVLALKNKLSQCQIYNETLGRKNQELFSALCNAYEVKKNFQLYRRFKHHASQMTAYWISYRS